MAEMQLVLLALLCVIPIAVFVYLLVTLVALIYYIVKNPFGNRSNGGSQTSRVYQETKAYITNGYFNAANDILQTAMRHKFGGGNSRRY